MEIWNEIQPYLVEIISSIGVVIAIITTKAKLPKKEILQRKLEKQQKQTDKDKAKLQKDLQKEMKLEEEIANEK